MNRTLCITAVMLIGLITDSCLAGRGCRRQSNAVDSYVYGCPCGEVILGYEVIEGEVIDKGAPATKKATPAQEKVTPAEDEESPFLSHRQLNARRTAVALKASLTGEASTAPLSTAASSSDPEAASLWYGLGYHAFWEGNYTEALAMFDDSIAASRDETRAWYYKALTERAVGQEQAAASSLKKAVQSELANPRQAKQIASALQRVQGPMRVRILKAQYAAKRTAAPVARLASGTSNK